MPTFKYIKFNDTILPECEEHRQLYDMFGTIFNQEEPSNGSFGDRAVWILMYESDTRQLIGCCTYGYINFNTVYIYNFGIIPQEQCKSNGTLLMEHMKGIFKSDGCDLFIECDKTSERLVNFYKKLGFLHVDELLGWHTPNEYYLMKCNGSK